jgi:hypothetical protein
MTIELEKLNLSRSVLRELVVTEFKKMIQAEVRRVIRKSFQGRLEELVNKSIWGPIDEARKVVCREEERKLRKLDAERHRSSQS